MESPHPEKKVTLLLTDMVGSGQRTMGMNPSQVAEFMIDYRRRLETLIKGGEGAEHLDHVAGDATISVFENRPKERDAARNRRAFRVALRLLDEMATHRILPTRIGLYSGKIIEARCNDQIVRFGSSFTAASRLQLLCSYFGTSLLMGREVAKAQEEEKKYIAAVGRITPKGIDHPIHMFTIYKPGINQCPSCVQPRELFHYIKTKIRAIEHFCGNTESGIEPNFPLAREMLHQAAALFREMTGQSDVATERILEYIRHNSYPTSDFVSSGMKLKSKSGNAPLGLQLFRLSQELLKALDREFYDSFILSTEWEHCFRLEWRKKGAVIIEKGAKPDGVYFLTQGEVRVLDSEGNFIATVREGDIFGEMAYFSCERVRNATVVANSDLVLYRISGGDFLKFPAIKNLFQRIAKKRAVKDAATRIPAGYRIDLKPNGSAIDGSIGFLLLEKQP
jgi:class 3 adenylate cyclase